MGEFIYDWPTSINFDFLKSRDGVQFVLMLLVILLTLLVCFVGTRVMVAIIYIELSIASGMFALKIAENHMSMEKEIRVIVFIAGIAIGGSILHSSVVFINRIIGKLHMDKLAGFIVAYAIPLCAAAFLWYYVVNKIYTGSVIVCIIAAAVYILGIIVRKKTGMIRQDFDQYEDR